MEQGAIPGDRGLQGCCPSKYLGNLLKADDTCSSFLNCDASGTPFFHFPE